jgi:hypothetical protein
MDLEAHRHEYPVAGSRVLQNHVFDLFGLRRVIADTSASFVRRLLSVPEFEGVVERPKLAR